MFKHLALSGCPVPENAIKCEPCSPTHAGGFTPSPYPGTIRLCAGNFLSKNHMEATVAHELIHMYDQCKFKVDWQNLRHHACSEIRANTLSGDCKFTRELARGVVAFSKNHQVRSFPSSTICYIDSHLYILGVCSKESHYERGS